VSPETTELDETSRGIDTTLAVSAAILLQRGAITTLSNAMQRPHATANCRLPWVLQYEILSYFSWLDDHRKPGYFPLMDADEEEQSLVKELYQTDQARTVSYLLVCRELQSPR
jgi:hypothetical protein